MTTTTDWDTREVDWRDSETVEAVRRVRHAVFVVEQDVPEELEWDGSDSACRHVIALDASGAVVGTGRLDSDDHIGRMAVAREARGQGAGRAVLDHLIAIARERGSREVVLNAQIHAMAFYVHAGFEAFGERFMEAGIEHQSMLKRLV
ncbi:MAG: GNAT family N-acetyltransferase [Pseudomonadota bacterium]